MKRWQDWVMLVLGIWLFLSPFILGYPDLGAAMSVNSYIFGAIVTALAIAALARPRMWEEWVTLVLGLWLIISPFALGFRADTVATTNHIIVGLLIALDAISVLIDFPTQKLARR
jgi:hypothetical protein